MINQQRNSAALSRRAFLKSCSATAVALSPFVPVLNLEAAEVGTPKRIIFVVTHNGTAVNEFFPDEAGRDFRLKRVLEPLQPFRDRMTILGNVNMDPAPSGAHTGQGMLLTNTITDGNRIGMGISVDQFIASQISADTPFGSVLLGNNSHANGELWLRGARDTIPAENNPYRSFDRLFTGDQNGMEIAQRRGSVIDGVLADLNAFRSKLPSDDQQLIDLHLDSLRSLERSLSSDLVCAAPELLQGIDSGRTELMPEISALNNQIAVAAMSCGLTRVIGMPFLRPVGDYVLSFLGINDGIHTISHNGVADSPEKFTVINQWFSSQVADLCKRLEETPEGEGSMLDNTLVVMSNPLSDGARHSKENLPIAMIGGDWHFDTGQYMQYSGEPHGKWLVSLCQAMGVDVSTFGETDTSQGPLPGITL